MITVDTLYRELPVLETRRLILRKVTLADLDAIFAYSSDEEVTRFLRWGPHTTREQTEAHLREVLQGYEAGTDGPWGIERREAGRLVGSIHLMEVSVQHRKAEIGFVLARPYWGRGLMTEALARVLEYSFAVAGLNRIEASCLVENRAGMAVLNRAGMRREGILREYSFQKGAFRDFCLYALLQREHADRRTGRG